jgi:hypothetical protein
MKASGQVVVSALPHPMCDRIKKRIAGSVVIALFRRLAQSSITALV